MKGEDCPGKSQCKFWQFLFKEPSIQTILKIRTQVQGIAKKYILDLARIDHVVYKKNFTFDSQHKAAMQSIKQIAASRYLDDDIVRKLAYLSASFKIFEELCLSQQSETESTNGDGRESSVKESNYDSLGSNERICRKLPVTAIDMRNMWLKKESICLSKIVDKALVSVISKQMIDSPTNILKQYILNQIHDGHFARVRGKRSDDKDVTVWYDPEKELFFLRAKTYYDELSKEHNLRITKSQFEDELAWDNAIVSAERKKGVGTQIRRSHEIKIAANGSKESVLKIRKSVLFSSLASDSAVLEAIETMTADTSPLRRKRTL